MLADGTADAASMVITIPAVNRFAVSGTPIVRGVDDMHGLLTFLDAKPYVEKSFWRRTIAEDYLSNPECQRKMHAIAARLIWRNTKDSIAHKICFLRRLKLNTN